MDGPRDTQRVELLGRNILITELLRAGIEIAVPLRDRGVDLIAYLDREQDGFVAAPIQMKASTKASFEIFAKYERTTNLLLAYVWYVDAKDKTVIYLLSYAEAVELAKKRGYTATPTWKNKGNYVVTRPGEGLLADLQPFAMAPDRWVSKIRTHGLRVGG